MQVAPAAAIIEVVALVPMVPVVREAAPATRQRANNWLAPSPLGRGQLIDLVV